MDSVAFLYWILAYILTGAVGGYAKDLLNKVVDNPKTNVVLGIIGAYLYFLLRSSNIFPIPGVAVYSFGDLGICLIMGGMGGSAFLMFVANKFSPGWQGNNSNQPVVQPHPAVRYSNLEIPKRTLNILDLAVKKKITSTTVAMLDYRMRGAPQPFPSGPPPKSTGNLVEVSPITYVASTESVVAVNPANPLNMIAGAAVVVGIDTLNPAYSTFDGGKSWQPSTAISNIVEGAAIAFLKNGRAIYATLVGTGQQPIAALAMSDDGGKTWFAQKQLAVGDKTCVAAYGSKFIVGWTQFGAMLAAVSLDNGDTLGVVEVPGIDAQGATCAIGADGVFHYACVDVSSPPSDPNVFNNLGIYYFNSKDGSFTDAKPTIVVPNVPAFDSLQGGFNDGDAQTLATTGTCMTIDANGTIYLGFMWKLRPMLIISKDNGKSWSSPIDVNPSDSRQHAMPTLCSTGSGRVSYYSLVYDSTLAPSGGPGKYFMIRHSTTDEGISWDHTPIAGPFTAAGPAPGFRPGFGDYCGASAAGGVEAVGFSMSPDQNWQTWVYSATATTPPSPGKIIQYASFTVTSGPSPPPSSGPTLVLSPNSGAPGISTILSGKNYISSSTYSYCLSTSNTAINCIPGTQGSFVADAQGNIPSNSSLSVPNNLSPGDYWVLVYQ